MESLSTNVGNKVFGKYNLSSNTNVPQTE